MFTVYNSFYFFGFTSFFSSFLILVSFPIFIIFYFYYIYHYVIHIHFFIFSFFSFSFILKPLACFYVWRTAGTMWGSLIYVYTSGGYTAWNCLNYERRQSFRPRIWKLTFLILLFNLKFIEILNLYTKLLVF